MPDLLALLVVDAPRGVNDKRFLGTALITAGIFFCGIPFFKFEALSKLRVNVSKNQRKF